MPKSQRFIENLILYDQKWHKLLKRAWLFQFFPFVDFVLVAGSMALGDVHENSDFDVIVGARFGRLYTARFFCLFFYKIFGLRSHVAKNKKADRFCFNHFVTEKSYCLKPPYNTYWQELYKNLAPVFGDEKKIKDFFNANQNWVQETKNPALSEAFDGSRIIPRSSKSTLVASVADQRKLSTKFFDFSPRGCGSTGIRTPETQVSILSSEPSWTHSEFIVSDFLDNTSLFSEDLRFLYNKSNFIKFFLEKILSGKIGDRLEQLFEKSQLWKIEQNLKKFPPGYKPRIIYNNEEVEIHLDTRRTETTKSHTPHYPLYIITCFKE